MSYARSLHGDRIRKGGLAFPVIVFYSLHGIVAVAALALVVYGSLSLKGIVS